LREEKKGVPTFSAVLLRGREKVRLFPAERGVKRPLQKSLVRKGGKGEMFCNWLKGKGGVEEIFFLCAGRRGFKLAGIAGG